MDSSQTGPTSGNVGGRFGGAAGTLEYGSGESLVTGAFQVEILPNGEMSIEVESDHHDFGEARGAFPEPAAFAGVTHDGRRLRVEGQIGLEQTRFGENPGASYLCFSGELAAVAPEPPEPDGLVATFDLVNLKFWGNQVTTYSHPGGLPTLSRAVSFTLDGVAATLTRSGDYEQAMKRIRSGAEAVVTASLRVSAANLEDIEQLEQTARRICSLLTLATGNLVTWVSWRLGTADGTVLREAYRTAIRRRMTGSGAIDTREPDELVSFLETAYPRFLELEARLELHRVADAYVDGMVGSFLQTKALAIGVLMEYIVGRYLADAKVRLRIFASRAGARLVRKSLIERMRTCIPEAVDSAGLILAQEAMDRIARAFENKLAFLNEPTLNDKLTELAQRVSVNLTEEDIRKFVQTRNELAHRMDFHRNSTRSAQYFHMRYVVERVLLSLLGYRGPYVDCRTWTRHQSQDGEDDVSKP